MLTLNELSNQCIKLQRLSDYLPILSLPHHLVEQIRNYKILCASIIGGYGGMRGIAHVTLRDDLMGKESFILEPQILAVASSIGNIYSIDLEINGFGYFENNKGKTIYMALELNPVSSLWFDNLRTAINAKKKSFIPHITITKQIPHKAFDNLWPIFEHQQFRTIFRAEKVTILKRDTFHYISNYQTFKEISFRKEIFNEDLALKMHSQKYLFDPRPKGEQFILF